MDAIAEVVRLTRGLEEKLRALGAEGRGMHEMLTTLEPTLEPASLSKGRFIASFRNRIMHRQFDPTPEELGHFKAACAEVAAHLDSLTSAPSTALPKTEFKVNARAADAPASQTGANPWAAPEKEDGFMDWFTPEPEPFASTDPRLKAAASGVGTAAKVVFRFLDKWTR